MKGSDFFKDLDFTPVAPAPGRVLISEPFMQDPNFSRSVVMLVEHNEEGSLGFVLNKKADIALGEILEVSHDIDAPVFIGGPVGMNQLFFIHTLGQEQLPGATRISGDLFFGGDFDRLIFYLKNGLTLPQEVKFFVGYSGWSPGQLEQELKDKAWIVSKFEQELALKDSDNFWKDVLYKLGKKFAAMTRFPENPNLN